jgi:cytochrome bd-type quinol oxidase subunit 1
MLQAKSSWNHAIMDQSISDTVIIPQSKTKILLHFLGALLFVAIGIWLWAIAGQKPPQEEIGMKGIAILGVLFFGACAIGWCIALFDRRPALVIDAIGIIDHSSGVSAGRIRWSEIEDIRVESMGQ